LYLLRLLFVFSLVFFHPNTDRKRIFTKEILHQAKKKNTENKHTINIDERRQQIKR
jgi:hypothetical protein